MTREAKGRKTREAERLRGVDEALKPVEMEDREEGPEGGCSLAGGSSITPPAVPQAQTHRPKPLDGCCVERWSVRGEYSAATGTNTDCPREESNNTVSSKFYTVYCMLAVDVCVHVCLLSTYFSM